MRPLYRGRFAYDGNEFETDALRAVTSVPAKIAGMQDRIGSLKTGLDADCVLWSGDPLDIATQVQAVFVNGTPEYRRTK